jgi:hypothetical protein
MEFAIVFGFASCIAIIFVCLLAYIVDKII